MGRQKLQDTSIASWLTPQLQELRQRYSSTGRQALRDRTGEFGAKRNCNIAETVERARVFARKRGFECPDKQCTRCHKTEHEPVDGDPANPRKFDVDHIDDNPLNDVPLNLQYMCVNCHRIKTEEQKSKKRK